MGYIISWTFNLVITNRIAISVSWYIIICYFKRRFGESYWNSFLEPFWEYWNWHWSWLKYWLYFFSNALCRRTSRKYAGVHMARIIWFSVIYSWHNCLMCECTIKAKCLNVSWYTTSDGWMDVLFTPYWKDLRLERTGKNLCGMEHLEDKGAGEMRCTGYLATNNLILLREFPVMDANFLNKSNESGDRNESEPLLLLFYFTL